MFDGMIPLYDYSSRENSEPSTPVLWNRHQASSKHLTGVVNDPNDENLRPSVFLGLALSCDRKTGQGKSWGARNAEQHSLNVSRTLTCTCQTLACASQTLSLAIHKGTDVGFG